MIECAVIGAGASALAASRHLVGNGLRPSIFEASKSLGGAWAVDNSKMWNGLHTNLSKYTCRFSDWPWPEETPLFPSATDMGKYLEGYSHHFLDPTYFQYQCQVTNIEAVDSGAYRVEWTDLSSSTKHSKDFQGVIVATGFFSKPNFPDGVIAGNQNNIEKKDKADRQQNSVLHSVDYVSPERFSNQTVAVIGSSFSAMEISVDVAKTAKRVIHVVPRIPWVIPRFIPFQEGSKNFDQSTRTTILPVDLALYRRRQEGLQLPELVEMKSEMCQKKNQYLASVIGTRQANTALGIPNNWDEPPLVAISDYYLDLVIQDDIEVVRGRLTGYSKERQAWEVTSPTGQPVFLGDVDSMICATGFKSSLDEFLHSDILDTIKYDSSDASSPLTASWDMVHPELPNLFFCGMYRGPYMGVMDQQGRLAANILSGKITLDSLDVESALHKSQQMREQKAKPQFPHFDYLGFLDTLTSLQKPDFPVQNMANGDMVSPAFYQSDKEISQKEVVALQKEVEHGQDGSRIPSVALSAIIGEWDYDRRIVHFSDNREEHVYGTVKYSRPALDHVLYREDGFYEISPSKALNVFREYEYQVADDCLELYFVEQGKRAHLFLSLKFSKKEGEYWIATSDHLCIKDLYKARFEIKLDGLAATYLKITYRVKGPSKDYESTTVLLPKAKGGSQFGRI